MLTQQPRGLECWLVTAQQNSNPSTYQSIRLSVCLSVSMSIWEQAWHRCGFSSSSLSFLDSLWLFWVFLLLLLFFFPLSSRPPHTDASEPQMTVTASFFAVLFMSHNSSVYLSPSSLSLSLPPSVRTHSLTKAFTSWAPACSHSTDLHYQATSSSSSSITDQTYWGGYISLDSLKPSKKIN